MTTPTEVTRDEGELVERLRDASADYANNGFCFLCNGPEDGDELLEDAADVIERLVKERDEARAALATPQEAEHGK